MCQCKMFKYLECEIIIFDNCMHTGHRCSVRGCGKVLVIDGNMKNHCAVCAASEAGYIEYDGLPGRVKTGCTNTPEQKNRFCTLHKPHALNSSSQSCKTTVIESILEKKETRSATHYKVRMHFANFHAINT